MTVQFKIGGNSASSSRLAKTLVDSAQKDIQNNLKKEIGKIRCPEHRKTLSNIRFKGSLSKNNFKLEANCCCDKLQDTIYSKVAKI